MKKVLPIMLALAMSVTVMSGCAEKKETTGDTPEEATVEKKEESGDTPEAVVEKYYDAVTDGDFEEALKYTTGDHKEEQEEKIDKDVVLENMIEPYCDAFGVDIKDVEDDLFESYMDLQKKIQKGIDDIEIEEAEIDDDEATVVVTLTCYDGDVVNGAIENEALMKVFNITSIPSNISDQIKQSFDEDQRIDYLLKYFDTMFDMMIEACKDADTIEQELEYTLVKEDGKWLISEKDEK
ncbi:MAG: hypothetical protein Q4B31_01080 [Clostridia bacterium]|nr:hypothetical protein [Clostridia bacterium]